jgi:hypothetical protein
MRRIVLPVVAAATRQGGHSISPTNATGSPYAANTANSPGPTNPASTTNASSTTNPAGTTKVAASPSRYRIRGPIAEVAAIAAADVRVAIEIVISVDVDVVAAPAAPPAPTTAPERTHHHANAKGDRSSGGVVAPAGVIERIVRIDRRTIHHHGIVRRHVHDFGICLLNHDHALGFDNFGLNFLLFGCLQAPLVLSFLAHALHGIHHIALLREEGIPHIRGPLNIVCQSVDNIRQSGHRLDACVPRLLCDRIGESLVLEILVIYQPLLKLDDFERIG